MHRTLLLAISYARNGDHVRARDVLYGFEPRSLQDEIELDYAWKRIEQLETMRVTP